MHIMPLLVKPSRISALVMVLLIASAMVSAVEARTIPLHDTHSADDIRNHCKDAGGTFSQDETGYGCSTNCKGGPADESGAGSQCSVSCSLSQKCKGYVPGRIRLSDKRVRGILSPRAAASR
jgi:hypothetical protein